MEKEYVVSLNKDVDYDQFWNEIESASDTDSFIPARRVEIIYEKPGSLRSCHYSLTDEEAATLRNDPRVYSVVIPADQRTDIKIGHRSTQSSDFSKTTSDSGTFVNYALRRCISSSNPYGTGTAASGDYTYSLDGTGVDVVISDSGIQADHPEFQDAVGTSRVQQINWFTAAGLPGTQSANFYRDFDGHGTHVAGIAAGKTYGWAKNSRIYSLKVNGLEGTGDAGTGISVTQCFDVIKLWHRNKPVDPVTGVKRPTIVNMSWGYSTSFTNILGGVYRTDPWVGNTRRTDYGMIGQFDGTNYWTDVRVPDVDVDVQEMLDEGIHICTAAGNSGQKVDSLDGIDYANSFDKDIGGGEFETVYYHQGGSPHGNLAINVGSTDTTVFNATTEQKSTFSNCGAGVDIYAPGSNIMSSTSTTNKWGVGSQPYYLNNSYRQTNISGTSMASPQVCGFGALLLQLNPKLTPAQLKAKVIEESQQVVYSTNLDNDYTNSRSISNGIPRFLYQKFNSSQPYNTSGGVELTNIAMTLR